MTGKRKRNKIGDGNVAGNAESATCSKRLKAKPEPQSDGFLLIGFHGNDSRLFPLHEGMPASLVPWAENEESYPDLKEFLSSHNWFSNDEEIDVLFESFFASLSALNDTNPLIISTLLSEVASRSQKWIQVLESAASSDKDDLAIYKPDEKRSYQPHTLPVINLECMAILHMLWFSSADVEQNKNELVISIQECLRTISSLINGNKQPACSSHTDDKKSSAKQDMNYSVDVYKKISLAIFRNIENALFSSQDSTSSGHLGLEIMSSVLTMIKFLVQELIDKEFADLELTQTFEEFADSNAAKEFLDTFPLSAIV
jgi:hypothetical protein